MISFLKSSIVIVCFVCCLPTLPAFAQINNNELINGDSRTWILDSVKTSFGEHIACDAQMTLVADKNKCYYRGDNCEVIKNSDHSEGRQISFTGTWKMQEKPEKVLTLEFTEADGYKKHQQTQIFIIRELTPTTLVATTTVTFGSTMEFKQYALFFRNLFSVPSIDPFFKEFTTAVVKNDTKKILSSISFPFYSHDLPYLCKVVKKKVKTEEYQSEFSEKEFSKFIPCLFTSDVKKQLQTYKPLRMENDDIEGDFFGVSYTYTFPFKRTKQSLLWMTFLYSTESKKWHLKMTDNVSYDVGEEE
jgi:hypothetical protein